MLREESKPSASFCQPSSAESTVTSLYLLCKLKNPELHNVFKGLTVLLCLSLKNYKLLGNDGTRSHEQMATVTGWRCEFRTANLQWLLLGLLNPGEMWYATEMIRKGWDFHESEEGRKAGLCWKNRSVVRNWWRSTVVFIPHARKQKSKVLMRSETGLWVELWGMWWTRGWGSRKLERPSVQGQVTDRHVLGMGTDVSRFKKKVSGQVHENQFRRVWLSFFFFFSIHILMMGYSHIRKQTLCSSCYGEFSSHRLLHL